MKKLVSLLLAVCMCLSVGVMLTACGDEEHTHTYKIEWTKDATHHWHACEGENCTDVADKAEHTWNDGEITTEATAEADGVKTFTCTVCGQTKTESVQLKTTVTEAEWNTALAMSNFTLTGFLTERDRQESLTMKITDNLIYTENDGVERYVAKQGDTWHMTTDGKEMGMVMNGVSASVQFAMMSFHMPGYASFTYDEETGAYVYVKSGAASGFYKFSVYFENGIIVKIEGEENAEDGVTHSFDFSDYGTTVVEIPTVEYTVTKEDWENAFNNDLLTNYTIRFVRENGEESALYKCMVADGKHTIYARIITDSTYETEMYLVKTADKYIAYQKADGVWTETEMNANEISASMKDVLDNWQLSYTMVCPNFSDFYDSFAYNNAEKTYVFEGVESSNEIETNSILEKMRARYYYASVALINGKINHICVKMSGQDGTADNIYFENYGTTTIELPTVAE